MIKKLLAVTAAATISSVAMAADENTFLSQNGLTFSGNVALTSDYRWRGQTQTENDPAIQGTFTLAHSSGLYVSVFASNVDFLVEPGGKETHLELDPSIGFTTPITLGSLKPTLDIGAAYYNYPSNSDLNFPEYYAKLSFADVLSKGDVLTPNIAYSNEFLGYSSVNNWYFNLTYTTPFADTGFGGIASVGYANADRTVYGNDNTAWDWKVGVNYGFKSVQGLSAELAAVGTNIEGYSAAANRGVDTGAVFTLTKAF
ncbi:MAG: TorF family putative porin [Acinetobacter sp.]